MTMKKMFKVICPMERNGHKWWMRVGSGFPNKDDSINIYLDALPTQAGFTLQLREYTEDDMRQSAERRNARVTTGHTNTRHADAGFDPSQTTFEPGPAVANQSTPF